MSEKLVEKLNKLVESGIKKSSLEESIGLPSNSLSAVLSGKKEMPESWTERITNYFVSSEIAPSEDTKLVVSQKGLQEKPNGKKLLELSDTMKKINKDFGEGTVMYFGSKPNQDYDVISTGSLLLDDALGIGGLPRGRMVEIFGMESSGKTTIAMNIIANAQKKGLKCLLVDAENSFDPEYAEALGIKNEELIYCQPSYGEQGFEVADQHITAGIVGVVVIDSVAAMIPKRELEGEIGDSVMGLHARLMSQVCRKMVSSASRTNTLVIFINQIRNKIGVMMGNPEVTTGGMALQFYASIRLRVSRSTTRENSVMNGDTAEGNLTTVKVIKNKCSPPFKSAQFYIMYGLGIDTLSELVDLAVQKGIIVKAGSWFSYDNAKIGQGKDSVKQLLADNEELRKEIQAKLTIKP
jgi:recombination protein RecA